MAMIKGIPVTILIKRKIGVDGFNHPIYEFDEDIVENVLVAPVNTDDLTTNVDLTGKKAVYQLAIPKSDDHDWKDAKVRFFNREWNTLGFPIEGIEENIPLDWNKKVMVELYE